MLVVNGRPALRMASVGTALPGPRIDNAMLGRRMGLGPAWEQWAEAFIGTRFRHLAVDLESGEPRFSLADLGETAGRRALSAAGLEPSDVDVMVMGTAMPDMLMPTTVNVIADRLGIDQVPTYQLQSGCSGAVQALSLAASLLLSGGHRTALVLGGDVSAKLVDPDMDAAALPPAQLVNLVLFGDGAGASVLTTEPSPGPVLRAVFTRLVGLGREPGQTLDWYGASRRFDGPPVTEDYKAIEEAVPVLAAESAEELLDALEWKPGDLSYVLPPQLSGRMTARIRERMGMPAAREVSCVEETGNNGNALVFFQLERLLSRLASGDRAVGVAIESSKWIKSGFALEAD
ncbi:MULTISPECIES: 3-oxoacyl-ACP synthase III family protein [unclassified Streptomyces]|uniref:3-oxoacyl-ACP synthase III family protein n=2 Tax=Streptomyces TaxID=1883 RepID=UPI002259CFDB|nr:MULTISPECIES: 3-oxoacyl-ACP synthase III family protein [unclassified Streptomyces]MCX5330381.1 3-oxoacyl-ACP synthase III family protein [Streptomyces sp. NBC_00140]MCX5359778.1 3-oxoacyl-ACP synthase III family protein [Streptomyces sp. NBC_00124]